MGIGRDDLLPEGLRAPADEEETARDAVDRLAQGVDAADAAGGRVAADASFDRNPRVAPAEHPDGVAHGERVVYPDDDGVAQRGADFGVGDGDGLGGGFEPAEPDAETPDLLGVGRAQRFELPAPQPEGLHRGRLRAQPCAVTGDVGRQGRLVFDQPPVLSVLDGMTGKEIDRVDWPERNDRYGNLIRQNRNQMGVAYLDGKTPYILAARGTYKLMVVDAWMLKDGKLQRAWRWDGDEENPIVRSMGAHSMVTADVDGDGRDEILLGSCMLDDNGTLLWSSGLGHSDKAYLCKLHPDMEGMQVFMVSEPKKEDGRGVSVVDAATGKLIWKIGQTTYHVGDGMVADFDSSHPGMECFASEDRKGGSTDKYLLTADGKKINTTNAEVPGCRNWIWWDADLLRETFKGDDNRWGASSSSGGRKQSIWKWQGEVLTEGIEGDILMIADLEGDWREELITALPGELRIYHTNIPARDRRVTLMQDPLYRSYVAHRSMGYPQAPVPSYYLGE